MAQQSITISMSSDAPPLLVVRDLVVSFPDRSGARFGRAGTLRVVDGVSLELQRGTSLGVVGVSGCGKTTLARAILSLVPVESGRIEFEGTDVATLSTKAMKSMRRRAQLVFQDPGGSLNARMRVRDIVGEPLIVHRLCQKNELQDRVTTLLESVGLDGDAGDRYPHAFSGGQRQRIAIARALAVGPDLLVCDEPTSSLDVSVQAQVLNLLRGLAETQGLTYLFISHDLAVVRHMSDRIAVMDKGKIVELGDADEVVQNPQHEKTRALLAAIPGRRFRERPVVHSLEA
jgi:ABC-type glutathione transport system ATPase component